jgi:hypothetical protein
MGSSNTEVMMMVVAVVACVLALVFIGVSCLDKSADTGALKGE